MQALGLEGSNPVKTPGEAGRKGDEAENQELGKREAREFRGIAARATYLAQDRIDMQYAVKELSRGMAKPSEADMRRAKRLGRYLVGKARVVTEYPWQSPTEKIEGYSDTDWAGCQRTAKSTSSGVLMRGRHFLRSWRSIQKCVTLSSGEAELMAAVRASTEVLGIFQLASDWGEDQLIGEVLVDSTAALGMVKRRGCGKLRHVRVGDLWIQAKQEEGDLQFSNVKGEDNPADVGTRGKMQEAHGIC